MSMHSSFVAAVLTGTALLCSEASLLRAETPGLGGPAPVISTNTPTRSPVLPEGGGPSLTPRGGRDWTLRQTPVVEAIRRVRDCVVNIHSERTVQGPVLEEYYANTPSQNRINGMGTGIIIDPRGYIITNQHVVEDVNVIRVRLVDGTVAPARIVARDSETDLALLKIDVK